MTLLPSSLLGRTALIIGGTLLLSQLAAFKLFQLYYQGPLIQQIAGLAVSQIRTVGFAITKLKDDARDEFLDELEEKEGIRVLFDNDSVLPSKLPEDRLLLSFADEVRKQLGSAIEFFVQPKSGRALWVKLPVVAISWGRCKGGSSLLRAEASQSTVQGLPLKIWRLTGARSCWRRSPIPMLRCC